MIFGKKEIDYVRNNYRNFGGSLVTRFVNQHGGQSYSFAFSGSISGFDYPACNRQKSRLAF
jgi:hypothetical protein